VPPCHQEYKNHRLARASDWHNITFPSAESRMESDLMSLCMMPLEWRNASACKHALHTVAICCSFILQQNSLHNIQASFYIFILRSLEPRHTCINWTALARIHYTSYYWQSSRLHLELTAANLWTMVYFRMHSMHFHHIRWKNYAF